MGQLVFSGENSLIEGETYLITVSGGVLDKDGIYETRDHQVSFVGKELSILIKGGQAEEFIINPLQLG
ncbi:hypothetical protein JCM19231_5198 [Vibrio ishigakensis]|uniref:Uncharacterized protein n=1 Tax=Vibrio ishigakensis TaxID=1481914 RepID=A0A0B8P0V8_9VIBR|nr:hypothetical protein JCM19231_5198 [Vibrio ishigakensis]